MRTRTTECKRFELFEILLVEDNPADVRLTEEALDSAVSSATLHVVKDGEEALRYLRREGGYEGARRPDLILLDLNLPRKDGREVLAEVKADRHLMSIPVIVLTTSSAEEDISTAYSLHANCYVTKKVDLNEFTESLRSIEAFWRGTATLPFRND